MATIDLNKVVVFVRVVEAGSMTRAAVTLGVPRSSVSRAVAQLEESLGVRLLQRTTRSLRPTQAGILYFDRASRALGALDDATTEVCEQEGPVRGKVRLSVPVDTAASDLANVLLEFRRAHPAIEVELVVTNRRVHLVEEGIDLALRAGTLRDSSLIARRVATLPGGLFAAPGYLGRRGTPRRLADLARHDVVRFLPRDANGTWRVRGPRGEERVDVRAGLGANDLTFIERALVAGAGVALLPEPPAAARDGRLVRVLPRYETPADPFHLVYPSTRFLAQRVALLRDFLLERLSARAP